MPHSGPEFDELFLRLVKRANPLTCLDVGIGDGKRGKMIRSVCPNAQIVGVEAEMSYASRFDWSMYTRVHCGTSIIDFCTKHSTSSFDLVVFGDVLEHLWLTDALSVLEFWQERSKACVAIWPIGYHQDAIDGVASEIHRCRIHLSDMVGRVPVIRYHEHDRGRGQRKCFAVVRGRLADKPNDVAYG